MGSVIPFARVLCAYLAHCARVGGLADVDYASLEGSAFAGFFVSRCGLLVCVIEERRWLADRQREALQGDLDYVNDVTRGVFGCVDGVDVGGGYGYDHDDRYGAQGEEWGGWDDV